MNIVYLLIEIPLTNGQINSAYFLLPKLSPNSYKLGMYGLQCKTLDFRKYKASSWEVGHKH